jgi:hypothetical protein
MSSKRGSLNAAKKQNELEEQAALEEIRRQYNEAQANTKASALAAHAQAQAKSRSQTPVGMEAASSTNHEMGIARTSNFWSSMPEAVKSTPMISQSMIMHMVNDHEHDTALNMRLQNTNKAQRLMVKDCVKTKLFRRLKFFTKGIHDLYDHRPGSVCAMIIANCNATHEEATVTWWSDMTKLVKYTITDYRNNVIKTMRLRFEGKNKQDC